MRPLGALTGRRAVELAVVLVVKVVGVVAVIEWTVKSRVIV